MQDPVYSLCSAYPGLLNPPHILSFSWKLHIIYSYFWQLFVLLYCQEGYSLCTSNSAKRESGQTIVLLVVPGDNRRELFWHVLNTVLLLVKWNCPINLNNKNVKYAQFNFKSEPVWIVQINEISISKNFII